MPFPPDVAEFLPLLRPLHRAALFPIVDGLWPSRCFACGCVLGPRQRLGACAECWAALVPLRPPVCILCGLPIPQGTDLLGPLKGKCVSCLLQGSGPAPVRAAVLYEGFARRLLLRAKIGRHRELFPVMARQLAAVLRISSFARGCDAVVPVPSRFLARRRRGFDPATEIARPLARVLGLPVLPGGVRRRPGGAPAKKLGLAARRALLRGAFRARGPLPFRRVLLVDDVLTTGSTAGGCTRALLETGVPEVRVAVWARTQRSAGQLGGPSREPG